MKKMGGGVDIAINATNFPYQSYYYEKDGKIEVIIVIQVRENTVEIVDYIGKESLMSEIMVELNKTAYGQRCSKIYFSNVGFDLDYLAKAGFQKQDISSDTSNKVKPRYAFANQPIRMTIGDGVVE